VFRPSGFALVAVVSEGKHRGPEGPYEDSGEHLTTQDGYDHAEAGHDRYQGNDTDHRRCDVG